MNKKVLLKVKLKILSTRKQFRNSVLEGPRKLFSYKYKLISFFPSPNILENNYISHFNLRMKRCDWLSQILLFEWAGTICKYTIGSIEKTCSNGGRVRSPKVYWKYWWSFLCKFQITSNKSETLNLGASGKRTLFLYERNSSHTCSFTLLSGSSDFLRWWVIPFWPLKIHEDPFKLLSKVGWSRLDIFISEKHV